jgi:hypothetical protein
VAIPVMGLFLFLHSKKRYHEAPRNFHSFLHIYPSEVIYSLFMDTVVISTIRLRLREEVLILSLDEWDFIDMGIDAWEIIQNL